MYPTGSLSCSLLHECVFSTFILLHWVDYGDEFAMKAVLTDT